MTLNSVVLPEPLGPIRPLIAPSCTSNAQLASAARRRRTSRPRDLQQRAHPRPPPRQPPRPSHRRRLRGPARGAGSRAAGDASARPLAEQQDHDQEQHAVGDQVGAGAREREGEVLLQRLEHERAKQRPDQRSESAEEAHQRDRHVKQRVERELREDLADEVRVEAADHADRNAESMNAGASPAASTPSPQRPVLVVTDRQQLQPESRAADEPGHGDGADEDDERDVVEGWL